MKAVKILQQALLAVKETFDAMTSSGWTPEDDMMIMDDFTKTTMMYKDVSVNVASVPAVLDYDGELDKHSLGTFAFCNRMFVWSSLTGQICQDLPLMTMLAMYNIGSIRHLVGLNKGSATEIRKAIHMYELALSTMDNIVKDPRWDDIVLRVCCCAVNNLGHAYECLRDTQKSSWCLGRLHEVMFENVFAVQNTLMHDDDFEFFLQYVGLNPSLAFNTATAA